MPTEMLWLLLGLGMLCLPFMDSDSDEGDETTSEDEPASDDPVMDVGDLIMDDPDVDAPSSDDPDTDAPDSEAPETEDPEPDVPADDEPDVPDQDEPEDDLPTAEDPEIDAPESEDPDVEPPANDDPDTDAPDAEDPTTDDPTTEDPDTDVPASEDPDSDAPDTEDPPAEETNFLSWTGEQTITGTEGRDALIPIGDRDLQSQTDEIDLLGGDDITQIVTDTGTTVLGGDGEDTLISTGQNNVLDGGADNDTLRTVAGNTLLGGAGDDTLVINSAQSTTTTDTLADGGDGADVFGVAVSAETASDPAIGEVRLTGGAGADTFDVTISLEAFDATSMAEATEDAPQLLLIEDFEPGVDMLMLQLAATSANDTSEISDVSVEPVNDTDVDIVLTFTDPDATTPLTASIRLSGVSELNAEDIILVQ